MTVEPGAAWGRPGALGADGVVVSSDAQARAVVEHSARSGTRPPVIGLLGGDLCKTLGGTGDAARLHSSEAMRFEVDVGRVMVDDDPHWFVAHLIARRHWWSGRTIAVMNAQFLGEWDLGPRAHPGDGLLDITDADLAFGQRLQARTRLRTGTHLPHPDIATARRATWSATLERPLDLWLDGTKVGRTATISVHVEPEALTVVV